MGSHASVGALGPSHQKEHVETPTRGGGTVRSQCLDSFNESASLHPYLCRVQTPRGYAVHSLGVSVPT